MRHTDNQIRFFVFSVCAFILGYVGLLMAQEGAIPQMVQDLRQAAEQCIAQRDFGCAAQQYEAIISTFPDTPYAFEALYDAAVTYIKKMGNMETADTAIQKLISDYGEYPQISTCLRRLATVYVSENRPVEGKQLCRLALTKEVKPQDAVLLQRDMAIAHVQLGEYNDAEAVIGKMIADYPDSPEIGRGLRKIASAYFKANQSRKAKELCQTALRGWPGHPEAIFTQRDLVINCIRLNEFDQADIFTENLIADYSDHKELGNCIGRIASYYFSPKKPDMAEKLCLMALTHWPDHSEVIKTKCTLASALIKQRKFEQADQVVEDLITNYPYHPEIGKYIQKIAVYYLDYDQPAKAGRLHEWLLEQDPALRSAEITGKMVQIFVELGDPNQAERELELLYSLYPKPADKFLKAVADLQEYYWKKQLFVKVVELGQRALILYPEHEENAWVQIRNIDAIMNLNGPKNVKYAIGLYQDLSAAGSDPKVQIRCLEGIGKGYVRLGDDAGVQEQIDLIYTNYFSEYPKEAASSILDIGEEYYWAAQRAAIRQDTQSAAAAYEKGIDVLAWALPVLPNAESRCMAFYMMGLNSWHLKQWQPAADYFLAALEAEPEFQYAGSLYWMIGVCYENMKAAGVVGADEAEEVMEWGYQTVFERYPEDRGALYAAMRLGEMNLARGRPVTACVYLNWILDHAEDNMGLVAAVGRLLEGKEVCQ